MPTYCNAQMNTRMLKEYGRIDKEGEELLRRAYTQNFWLYNKPEIREFEHLLVSASQGTAPARLAAAQAFAQALLLAILAKAPRTLADVVDDARARGAAAGFEVNYEKNKESRSQLEPEFSALLFSLPEAKIGERVVHSRHGFHLVRCGSVSPAFDRPFEVVKDDVTKKFEPQYRQMRFHAFVKELRGRYDAKVAKAAELLFRDAPARRAGGPAAPTAGGR